MDKPFLPLAISYIIGIIIGNYFHIDFIYLLGGFCISITIIIFNIFRERNNILNILIIFVILGVIITTLKSQSKILKYENTRIEYLGIVEEIISTEDNVNKYIVSVDSNIDYGEEINERITLNVIGGKPLNYGEKILFNGVVDAPLDNTNPMLYNHRLNLLSNNIYGTMTINDYSLQSVDSHRELRFRAKEWFHKEVNRVFDTNLEEGNKDIIKSILLADSSYMMDEELDKYRELGLGHILAISGLHIGIISSFILFILKKMTVPRNISSIVTIITLIFYSYLIGFPHSMTRGIIMFSLIILTKLLNEHSNLINILALSALIVLLINPFSLFSLGFILSYIAVLSLYLLTNRIDMYFYPNRGYISTTLSTILAVNIGLLPIQVYYFNYVSLLGIFANLINIPILSISLILSICMYVLDYILPFLSIGLSLLVNILLDAERIIGDILHNFSGLILNISSPSIVIVMIYYLAVAIGFKVIDVSVFNINVKKSILIFLCFIISINFVHIIMDNSLELHFIDVGQGDSILIRSGDRNVLVDTGGSLLSNYVGENITLPYLQKLGINKLDGIIISHFDADHSGALPTLIENIVIKNIFGSYIPEDNDIYNKIEDSKIPFIILKKGDVFRINENIVCEVLWPEDVNGLNSNNKSLVLSLNYNDYGVLLTGDIEAEVEQNIIDKIHSNIHLMKIAHHGSKTSSTNEFIERVKPMHSVLSVGRNNQFNHPNDEVMSRLKEIKSSIYRTDEMGLIKVDIDKDLVIEPFIEKGHNNVLEFSYEVRWDLTFYLIYYIITKKLIFLYMRSGADIYELC